MPSACSTIAIQELNLMVYSTATGTAGLTGVLCCSDGGVR